MFVDTFIKRPVLASVCSIVIVLVGAVSIPTLPIAQYPQIALPQVTVTSVYTGASSETVESAVTIPLEQAINGVQGSRYITSSSSNNGTSTITITFDPSRDVDLAAVDVQNLVSTASARLPQEVQNTGISITRNTSAIVLAIGVYSPDGRYDPQFLSNYLDIYVTDAVKRVPGVGNVNIFGQRRFSMRLWVDPVKLASRGLTPADVVRALQEQNVQVAAGQVGQSPAPAGQAFTYSVRVQGRLPDAEAFNGIVLKTGADGALVRLRDVGHAELGAQDYASRLRFNGREAVGLGIYQLPQANALDVREAVLKEVDRLSQRFPPGIAYELAFDTTLAVSASIEEVLRTLLEAVALVILVIFVFLQSARTTLIPAIAIPVSLVGTFAFVKLFGFSINTLTLFGITLATGLVVDDAIVVVENIARVVEERHMRAKEAASEGMREVTGAIIAISLVLVAVFVPVAFIPGTTGRIYQQFALTIAVSMVLSAFCSLTLTPALAALLVKEPEHGKKKAWFFRQFDRGLDALRRGHIRSLRVLLRHKLLTLVAFLLLLALTAFMFRKVPGGFIPEEDQGYFIVIYQAPEGASLDTLERVMRQAEAEFLKLPERRAMFSIAGFSLAGSGSNYGISFVSLKPWEERAGPGQDLAGIIGRLRGPLGKLSGAVVTPFAPPAIQGVGSFGGFQFILEDQAGSGDLAALAAAQQQLVGAARSNPGLAGVFSAFNVNSPQLLVQVDRDRAKALNVGLDSIFSTLQVFLGSAYVNDFDFASRTYRVYVQAEALYRANPKDIESFYVRSSTGAMVPLGTLLKVEQVATAPTITRYNLFRSVEINGAPAPGRSSGQALDAMDQLAGSLPSGFGHEWTGLSLEQKQAGGQTVLIFALGILFVYLVLSAQYESYTLPISIILVVPLALLGALLAQWLRGFPNDVYCQIGMVMLVGLSSKNAILIVEFAAQLRGQGKSIEDAALDASELRLRPILMTSIAFILGVVPLATSTGAGAAARMSLGTAVLGGMLVSTVLSLFFVPVLYALLEGLRERARPRHPVGPPRGGHGAPPAGPGPGPHAGPPGGGRPVPA